MLIAVEDDMQRKLIVVLSDDEREALQQLADLDLRFPEHQLRALVRDAARERGLWPPTVKAEATAAPCEGQQR
jgi:hypothetical protein